MGNLSITAADVSPVEVWEKFTGPTTEVITAGMYVRYNTTSGKIEKGNASSASEGRMGGIAIFGASVAGITITAVRRGIIDVGDALGDLAFDADVYLSNTDGTLATSQGTGAYIIGTVVPAWNSSTADKLLRVWC
jgi:hypothetical protein